MSNFNFWKHLRLAGAAVIVASCFVDPPLRTSMVLLGLLVQHIAVMGGLDRVERIIDTTLKKENTDETNA